LLGVINYCSIYYVPECVSLAFIFQDFLYIVPVLNIKIYVFVYTYI